MLKAHSKILHDKKKERKTGSTPKPIHVRTEAKWLTLLRFLRDHRHSPYTIKEISLETGLTESYIKILVHRNPTIFQKITVARRILIKLKPMDKW